LDYSKILNSIDATRMYNRIVEIASSGPRDPASRGDAWSRQYILDEASELGARTWTRPCKVVRFATHSASLKVLEPVVRDIPVLPQDRCDSTPAGGTVAQVEYARCGGEDDYQGMDAQGKVMLQDVWGLHMLEKIRIGLDRGVKGLIWMHSQPGGKRSAWGLAQSGPSLPVVGVSFEDGRWLRDALAAGPVKVNLDVRVSKEPATSDHIFAEMPGPVDSRQAMLLVAHRDTTHVSPGANDNGSGISVVLEVLRAFTRVPLPFRLAGFFTTAEEGGGLGVEQYAASHLGEDFPQVKGVISLDMVGVGSKLLVVKGDRRYRTSARINGLLEESASTLGYHLGEYEMPMGLADITPLVARGIESAWLFKPDDPRVHTDQDIPDFVNPNDLKAAADIVACAIWRLAQQP